MGLVTVFFNYEGKYARALVDSDQIEFFLNLGAKKTPQEALKQDLIEEAKEVLVVESNPVERRSVKGDQGSGEPGSLKFHELKIAEASDFTEVKLYCYSVTGKLIRKKAKATVDHYRKNALMLIKRHLNADQSG